MSHYDIVPDGVYAGGCNPRVTKIGQDPMGSPVLEDKVKIIPRNRWEELIPKAPTLSYRVKEIKDQNGEGQCASAMTAGSKQVIAHIQGQFLSHYQGIRVIAPKEGDDKRIVRLSAASLYKRVNDEHDGGSSIDRNLEEIAARGILPVTGQGFEHEFQAVGFEKRLPGGWQETGKHFRFTEWYDVATVEGFVTCLLLGHPVCYGRKGHAILAIQAVWENGKLFIIYLNSWNNWGDPNGPHLYGFGRDAESDFARWIESYGAWSPRVTTGG